MREKVLSMLKEHDDYISGQELSERLEVSRTAVWKAVNALRAEGYAIESIPNRGYHLTSCPDVLLSEEIKSHLKTKVLGNKILHFDTIDSTNNEVKRLAEQGAEEGLIVIAEEQTAGRGRRGRTWSSPPGCGIWMSILLRPELTPWEVSSVTLVSALACAKAIRDELGLDALIKWPNDIVINGKKAVGILTEMSAEQEAVNYVVLGVGMNANISEFPEEISNTATSFLIESGSRINRSLMVAKFVMYFEKYYEIFCNDKTLTGIKAEYEKLLVNKDRDVFITEASGTVKRRALGINDKGELVVENDTGERYTVRAGEVSVRGIYGYV